MVQGQQSTSSCIKINGLCGNVEFLHLCADAFSRSQIRHGPRGVACPALHARTRWEDAWGPSGARWARAGTAAGATRSEEVREGRGDAVGVDSCRAGNYCRCVGSCRRSLASLRGFTSEDHARRLAELSWAD